MSYFFLFDLVAETDRGVGHCALSECIAVGGSSHVNEWVLLRIYIYIYTRVTDQMKSTHRRSIVFGEDDEEDDDEEEEDEEEEDEEEEEEEEDEQKKHQQQQQGEKTRDSDGASTERAKTEQQHTTSISIPADHFAVDSTCTSAGTGSTQSDVEAACAASRPNNRTTRMNRSRSISSRDCDVDAIGPAIPIAVSERSALRDAAAFVALEQQLSSVHALSRGATAGYFGTRVMDAFAMCHTHTHTHTHSSFDDASWFTHALTNFSVSMFVCAVRRSCVQRMFAAPCVNYAIGLAIKSQTTSKQRREA